MLICVDVSATQRIDIFDITSTLSFLRTLLKLRVHSFRSMEVGKRRKLVEELMQNGASFPFSTASLCVCVAG